LKNPDYLFKRKNNSKAFDDAIDRRMVPITDSKLCGWLNRFVATPRGYNGDCFWLAGKQKKSNHSCERP
jgi:hypothetical protein